MATKTMITGSRGAPDLLAALGKGRLDVEAALGAGVLYREKAGGVWAYAASAAALNKAKAEMAKTVQQLCRDWLLVRMPIVASSARKQMKADVAYDIAQALLRDMVRDGDVEALPMLTEQYAPYFSVYLAGDQDEIDRYLQVLHGFSANGGDYRQPDLPDPIRPRKTQAWREGIFAHGEFLGLGRYEESVYVATSRAAA